MSRRILITIFATMAIVSAGVFVVAAQDEDAPPPAPAWMNDWSDGNFGPGMMHNWADGNFGPGMMHNWSGDSFGPGMMHNWTDESFGPGMMYGGFGPGMMWGDEEPMMLALAEAIGLEQEAFFDAMSSGQTLAQIAEAQGVELDAVYAAMTAEAEARMAELVEAGTITQEEADAHLAWMQENFASMPMFSGTAPCLGGEGAFGPGMMGRGRWN